MTITEETPPTPALDAPMLQGIRGLEETVRQARERERTLEGIVSETRRERDEARNYVATLRSVCADLRAQRDEQNETILRLRAELRDERADRAARAVTAMQATGAVEGAEKPALRPLSGREQAAMTVFWLAAIGIVCGFALNSMPIVEAAAAVIGLSGAYLLLARNSPTPAEPTSLEAVDGDA